MMANFQKKRLMISALIANLLPCFICSSTGQILVSVDCLHPQELELQWLDRFVADYSIGTQEWVQKDPGEKGRGK